MKLRISDNNIRIRLKTDELDTLLQGDPVRMSTALLDREHLVALRISTTVRNAFFCDDGLMIELLQNDLDELENAEEGIDFKVGTCDISIQKDFKCIGRSEELNVGTFPNPKEGDGTC